MLAIIGGAKWFLILFVAGLWAIKPVILIAVVLWLCLRKPKPAN